MKASKMEHAGFYHTAPKLHIKCTGVSRALAHNDHYAEKIAVKWNSRVANGRYVSTAG